MIPGTNHYQSTFARTLRRDFTDVNGPEDVFGVDREEIPAYVLETEPGDAVVWDYRTIHASFGGRQRRRLLSLNFKEAAAEPAGAG
jgi:ectoine hydroxylase-related dioxygenase (phytanoyl-CoA dioxygenase family)